MKSLFRTFAAEPEIVPVFNQSSWVLKDMNLRSLFMGLTMIKLNGRRMKVSSAALTPREIIERMVDAGEVWADGRPQDDDITFVALKVKL